MKKLIFDFDGTLVDSMPYWAQKMIGILERRGIQYPADLLRIITPLGDAGTAKYYIAQFGICQPTEALMEEMDAYALPAYETVIPAKATVADTLSRLKRAGYSLNVLTASPHKMLDVCLKRLGLWELFDNVWSCDDYNTTKSNPEIYRMVAQRLDTVPENCVFFDDNYNALATAKSAGMQVVGVYDDSSRQDRESIEALSSFYIDRFEELTEKML